MNLILSAFYSTSVYYKLFVPMKTLVLKSAPSFIGDTYIIFSTWYILNFCSLSYFSPSVSPCSFTWLPYSSLCVHVPALSLHSYFFHLYFWLMIFFNNLYVTFFLSFPFSSFIWLRCDPSYFIRQITYIQWLTLTWIYHYGRRTIKWGEYF